MQTLLNMMAVVALSVMPIEVFFMSGELLYWLYHKDKVGIVVCMFSLVCALLAYQILFTTIYVW